MKIPPFRLKPEPLDAEAASLRKFESAPPETGTKHQLGGEPTFLQKHHEWPNCPSCKERMTFYGQLDSINDDIVIADCGMVYVFVCLECNESASFIQSN